MTAGFKLDRPVYTPRDVMRIYSTYVRPVSYPTVLEWIKVHKVTGGTEGIEGHQSPRSNRYLITRDELERVLLQAGARKG